MDQSGHICPGKDTCTLIHPEDRSKGLFGMIQGSITVVENTDAIPQLGIILRGVAREVRGGEGGFNLFIPWETEANREPADKRCTPFADHHA